MAITREQKEQIVAELTGAFKDAKSVMFADNKGVTVKQSEQLRRTLRENGVQFKVAKRTLIRRAAAEAGFDNIPDEYLDGSIAAAFALEDEVAGAKIIYKLGKEFEALPLKGGIMDGEIFGADHAIALAKIPGRDELYAKLVGSLMAPVSGFHGVLYGTMRQFVGTLQALVDQGDSAGALAEAQEAEQGEAAAPEEAPAEEEAPAAEEAPAKETPVEEAVQTDAEDDSSGE